MDWYVPGFVALTLDAEVLHPLTAFYVADAHAAQLFTANAVIEQGGDYGTIPYTLQRVQGRGL